MRSMSVSDNTAESPVNNDWAFWSSAGSYAATGIEARDEGGATVQPAQSNVERKIASIFIYSPCRSFGLDVIRNLCI
jgi:hypothetical protein